MRNKVPAERAFLVERYWPGIDAARLQDILPCLDAAARALSEEGHHVEHVLSMLMPADQVVFSVVRADTEDLVRELNGRAGLPFDRIAEVTWHVPVSKEMNGQRGTRRRQSR